MYFSCKHWNIVYPKLHVQFKVLNTSVAWLPTRIQHYLSVMSIKKYKEILLEKVDLSNSNK